MSSTNKTPNLKLNRWVGSDVPCREDFVRDNNIVDNFVSQHTNNSICHVSPSDRTAWSKPIHIQSYFGDGNDYKTITLNCDFVPRWGLVFARDYPVNRCDFTNTTNYHYFGIFELGSKNIGLELSGKTLTVKNEFDANFEFDMHSFNQRDITYNIVAFR